MRAAQEVNEKPKERERIAMTPASRASCTVCVATLGLVSAAAPPYCWSTGRWRAEAPRAAPDDRWPYATSDTWLPGAPARMTAGGSAAGAAAGGPRAPHATLPHWAQGMSLRDQKGLRPSTITTSSSAGKRRISPSPKIFTPGQVF
eukprot:scaffold10474_cov122-Isochrysis_galbana.AAC.1